MECNKCKKKIIDFKNGLPNSVGFTLESGKRITLCQKCICHLGTLSGKEKDEFFEELGY